MRIGIHTLFVSAAAIRVSGRLFKPLASEVARRAFRAAVERCEIVPGKLTDTAGVFGAVAAFKVQTWGAA